MTVLKEGYVVVGPWWKSQNVSLSSFGRLVFHAEGSKDIEMDLNLQEWAFSPSEIAPNTYSFRLHTHPSSSAPPVPSREPSFTSSGAASLSRDPAPLPPPIAGGSSILPSSISSQPTPTIYITFQSLQEMGEWSNHLAWFDQAEEEEEKLDLGAIGVVDAMSLAPKSHKAGYLFKAGKNLLKQWPKRYVILTHGRIFYYKTPSDDTPLGEIDVSLVTVKLSFSDKKLTLGVPSRQYYFAAESGEEVKEWSEIILERKERLLGGVSVVQDEKNKKSSFKLSKPLNLGGKGSSTNLSSPRCGSPRGERGGGMPETPVVGGDIGDLMPEIAIEAQGKCDLVDQYYSFASSVERKLKKKAELEEELRKINEELAISFSKFSTQVEEVHLDDEEEPEESHKEGEEGWVQFTKGKKKSKKPRVKRGENANEGLGPCLSLIAEVYRQDSERCRQKVFSEGKLLAHFSELTAVSSQQFHKLRSEYDVVVQSYTVAAHALRDLGSKSKAKLELVKTADRNKNEQKGKVVLLAKELKLGSMNVLLQENASLLHFFGHWGKEWESSFDVLSQTRTELQHKSAGWVATGEGVFANFAGLLATQEESNDRRKGYTISGERANSHRTITTDRKKKLNSNPVVKRMEELVREEKKFVNLFASVHNLFHPALKEKEGEWSQAQNRMIDEVFGDKFMNVLDFHQRFLKGVEKVLKGWVSASGGSRFSSSFQLGPLSSLLSETFSADNLRPVDKYLQYIPSIVNFLDQMGKNEAWRSICRHIEQKQDLDELNSLFLLPSFHYDQYSFFVNDILDNIPEKDPEFRKIHYVNFFLRSFVDVVNRNVGTASHDWSSLSSTILGLVDLSSSRRERYVVKVGNLDSKGVLGEKERALGNQSSIIPGNYAILLNDTLITCLKEQSGLKFAGVYYLCEMEGVVKGEEGVLVTTPQGNLCLSTNNARALTQWEKQLRRGIRFVAQTIKKFGVPLNVIMRREDTYKLPEFLNQCFGVLVKNADSEGIFRLSGMAEGLRESVTSLDRGVPLEIGEYDEHSVAGIVKQFLRDLPDSLLTGPLSEELVSRMDEYDMGEKPDSYISNEQLQKSGKILTTMLLKLPISSQVVLRELLKVLDVVVAKGEENKMGPHNLAIVFTPNVLAATTPFHPSNCAVFERIIMHSRELIAELGKNTPTSKIQPYSTSLLLHNHSRRQAHDKDADHDDDDDESPLLVAEEGGGAELGVVVKEGWLQKKGGGTTRSNWKKRYFVVKYGSLAYFSQPGSTEAIGRVSLVDCLVGQSSSKKANCFAVTTSNRTYLFSAPSPAERVEWIAAIHSCLETSY